MKRTIATVKNNEEEKHNSKFYKTSILVPSKLNIESPVLSSKDCLMRELYLENVLWVLKDSLVIQE